MPDRKFYVGTALGIVSAFIIWQVGLRKPPPDAAVLTCDARLERCVEEMDAQAKQCTKLIAPALHTEKSSAVPEPTATASATPAVVPAPDAWKPLDDLVWLAGTWVSEDKPEVSANAKLVDGAVRVEFKKNNRKAKTPWSLAFIAPRAGHTDGLTAGGGCGFYEKEHQQNDGEVPWRQAYCSGYGKGDSLKAWLRLETDGKRVRIEIDGWISSVMVRR